jgi:hypothetical protein
MDGIVQGQWMGSFRGGRPPPSPCFQQSLGNRGFMLVLVVGAGTWSEQTGQLERGFVNLAWTLIPVTVLPF